MSAPSPVGPAAVAAEYRRYHRSGVMSRLALAAHGADHRGQTSSATLAEVERAVGEAGVGPGARILDAGCGNGCFAVPLALAGHAVHGIDISDELVAAAGATAAAAGVGARCRFTAGDFAAVDGIEPVDLVLAVGSLYWGPDLDRVVGAWRRLLRPGGAIVVMANLQSAPLDDVQRRAVGQTSFIPADRLVAGLEAAGLEVHQRDETATYAVWCDRWCAAMDVHAEEMVEELGAAAAAAIVTRFRTYRHLAHERIVRRMVLVGVTP